MAQPVFNFFFSLLVFLFSSSYAFSGSPPIRNPLLLKARQALFQEKNKFRARYFLKQVVTSGLTPREADLYRFLSKKIYIRYIPKERLGLIDSNISFLYRDREDIWIGSWAGGISRYTPYANHFKVFAPGSRKLFDTGIRGFASQADTLWIAAPSHLFSLPRETEILRSRYLPKKPGTMRIQQIFSDQETLFVLTSFHGLWSSRRGQNWRQVLPPSGGNISFNVLMKSRDGAFYLGTGSGLFRIKQSKNSPTMNGLRYLNIAENITTITEDGDSLWLGTYGKGIEQLNRKTKEVRRFTKEKNKLKDNWIITAGSSPDFLFWGTLDGGIAFYALKTKKWGVLDITSGLSTSSIGSLLFWDGRLYVGTLGKGLNIIDQELLYALF